MFISFILLPSPPQLITISQVQKQLHRAQQNGPRCSLRQFASVHSSHFILPYIRNGMEKHRIAHLVSSRQSIAASVISQSVNQAARHQSVSSSLQSVTAPVQFSSVQLASRLWHCNRIVFLVAEFNFLFFASCF